MDTYNDFQYIWMKNIKLLERERNKLNSRAVSFNYKANKDCTTRGNDITLIERVDLDFEKKRNKDLMKAALDSMPCDEQAFKQTLRSSCGEEYPLQGDNESVNMEFNDSWLEQQTNKRRQNKSQMHIRNNLLGFSEFKTHDHSRSRPTY
jgi:hypothetical protein